MKMASDGGSTVAAFKDTSWQLSSIENVDAGSHIKNNGGGGESKNSKFLPKALSRKLQKPPSQPPGNGNQTAQNRLGESGTPTDNFSLRNNVNTQHIISHEFLKNDPAFNPARLSSHKTPTTANVPQVSKLLHANAKRTTKGLARSVLHPRRSIIQHYQGKTAKGLSKATRPYLTPQADREFLAEYDALFDAEYSQATGNGHSQQRTNESIFTNGLVGGNSSGEEYQINENQNNGLPAMNFKGSYEVQRKKVELLEAHRQSLAVAWITSRYIKRVRLAPSPKARFPKLRDEILFERHGKNGEARFRWEKYIGEVWTQPLRNNSVF